MPFETQVIPAAPEAHSTPFLIVVVPQGPLPGSLAALDQASGRAMARCYDAGDFAGKKDESVLLYPEGPRPRLLLVGVGTPPDQRAAIRRAAAVGAKRARTTGGPSAALFVTPAARGATSARAGGDGGARRARPTGVPSAAIFVTPEARGASSARAGGQAAAEGAAMGAWHFVDMKRPPEERKPALERIEIDRKSTRLNSS